MKPIKTYTELMYRLKSANLDVKDYDYIEDKTKDDYLTSHPFIFRGRRFYRNPFFLTILFDNNLVEEVYYITSMKDFNVDYNIFSAFIMSKSKFTNKIFKKLSKDYFENDDIDSERKEIDMDNMMVDCAIAGRLDYYQYLEQVAMDNDVKPKYKAYSNSGNGYCLYNASKLKSDDFVKYLLENDVNVTLNDSMAFTVACKEGNYSIALELAKHGIDIHTKKNLGLMMILRNDRLKHLEITDKDMEAREELMKLFQEATNSNE